MPILADAIDAPEAVRFVTVAVVNSDTPAFMEAIEALVADRLVITATPALIDAMDAAVNCKLPILAEVMLAPVAVKFVTVAVVSSATPALTEATEALVAVKLVTVAVVIAATAALTEAVETVGRSDLPVTASVLPSVAAPVTANVPPTESGEVIETLACKPVLPVTVSVPLIVVLPNELAALII